MKKINYHLRIFTLVFTYLVLNSRLFSQEFNEEDIKRDVIGDREKWIKHRLCFPFDSVPNNLIENGYKQRENIQLNSNEKSSQPKFLTSSKWQTIGPDNIGGRVRCIASSPFDNSIIFIATASGGLWKSIDGALTWKPVFDNQNSIAFGVVTFDPNNKNVMYVGTGEEAGSDGYYGAGIFKSTDLGETWNYIGLKNIFAITKIYVSKINSNIIYVVGIRNGGFFKSIDGGVTWTNTVTEDIYDLAVNSKNPEELYICGSNVKYSNNGGSTFTSKTVGMESDGRMCFAISESNPNILYGLISKGGNAEVYKTIDKGVTWSLLKTFDQSFFKNQQFYNICITVNPVNPNIVFIGGIDIWRSSNGGEKWKNITNSYTGNDLQEYSVHPDQHWISFDPTLPEIVYIGNDGGSYFSVDDGVNWQTLATTLPVTQFYRMDIDQRNANKVYGGSQDNGSSGSYGVNKFNTNWKGILGGDGFYCVVDLIDSEYVYAEVYNGDYMTRINPNNPFFDKNSIGSPEERGLWSSPMVMSPADKYTLFTGRRNLYSVIPTEGGWKKYTPNVAGFVSCIGLSMHTINDLCVGGSDGGVMFSIDLGKTWGKSIGIPTRNMTDLKYDPVIQNRVYAVCSGFSSGHVFVSNDKGKNFTNISRNLPDVPFNSIEIDPNNNKHLFVGTDVGVFVSIDEGTTWNSFNNGLPNVRVTDLRIHMLTKQIYCATFGRSMWRTSITDEALPQTSIDNIDNIANDIIIKEVVPNPIKNLFNIYYSSAKTGNLKLDIRDINGKLVIQKVMENTEIGINSKTVKLVNLPNGSYFLTIYDGKVKSKMFSIKIEN